MNLRTKTDYAKSHVDSIADHDDEDLLVRRRALSELKDYIEAKLAAAEKRAEDRAGALFGTKE